ncbi:MAG: hypothetical protein AABY10_00785 [Nanoarchaeota archaeon]
MEDNGTGIKKEIENMYSKPIRIEKIGPELYRLEELDSEKGYRISTINSKTGQTILEKKF